MDVALSDDAIALLAEACRGNRGFVSKARTGAGLEMQANGRVFTEVGNGRSEARWSAALDELIDYGLVQALGFKGEVFEVTYLGYQVIDNKIPKEEDTSTDQ